MDSEVWSCLFKSNLLAFIDGVGEVSWGESVHSFLNTSCDNDRLLNDVCLFDVGANNIEQLLRANGTT
jgi:hypothetical protein